MVLSLSKFYSSLRTSWLATAQSAIVIALISLLAAGNARAASSTTAPAPAPMTADHVLKHLDSTVDWYRRVTSIDTAADSTEEVLFRESVRKSAQQSLHLGFDFARTEAELLGPADPKARAKRDHRDGRRAKLAKQATTRARLR